MDIGPLVKAGADLGGTAINWGLTNRQLMMQKEFAQNAIRWRVDDAKAAGLHPLFALGAQVSSPSPIGVGDVGAQLGEVGQSLGSAVTRSMDAFTRRKSQLELEVLASQLGENDARADYYRSEAAKNRQAGMSGLGVQTERLGSGLESQAPAVGGIDVQPAPVVSGKGGHPESQAGQNPYYEEQLLAEDFPIMLPRTQGESAEEIISEMSLAAWAGLLLRNSQIYGPGWLEDLMRMRYLGKDPQRRYKQLGLQAQPERRMREKRPWSELVPPSVRESVDRSMRFLGEKRFKRRYKK